MRGRNTRADRRARAEAQSQSRPAEASDEGRWRAISDRDWTHIFRKIAPELALDRYGFEMKPYMLDLMHQGMESPFLVLYQKGSDT